MSADTVLDVKPLTFPWQTVDPFLLCVYHDDNYPKGNDAMGPAASLAGRDLGHDFAGKDGWRMYHGSVVPGFPAHPHRGFETVTIVRRGLIDHADSLGAAARFGGGDVQWLTAGQGVSHSEMFPLLDQDHPNPLELFQIWLNLPAKDKMAAPYFTMLWADDIPRRVFTDAAGARTEVACIAGRLADLIPPPPPPNSWAAAPESELAIWTIKMDKGAHWTLPAARGAQTRRNLYFFKGADLMAGGRAIRARSCIELRATAEVELTNGDEPAEFLLLQGKPIGEPVTSHGPFVMNTQAEIRQAMADYQRTRFGGWSWGTDAPVHQRERGRFARHADGRVETK
jgi:quercetin 2,3-dioxygenase